MRVAPVVLRGASVGSKVIPRIGNVVTRGRQAIPSLSKVVETTVPAAKAAAKIETEVKVKSKKKSDCGEQKGYKDSQKENYAETPDGTKMDRDHIPAKQYMIEKAKTMAKKMDKSFNDCVKKAIINEAKTIMIPKTMHGMGYSYGQSADAIKKSGDLSKSANDIAKRDADTYRDLMDKDNPKNKNGNPLSEEEKKKWMIFLMIVKKRLKKGLKRWKKKIMISF